ncbi:hypothetical protein CP532_0299 [Ophiocordyceps camponoti-leonardi (nom. inval.)]|nr:hypothetical protein CP532_0299 [Ophiocordyceps camponoti-leonardi (nom. inval.)]
MSSSAAASKVQHRIYLGLWIDWSRGQVNGATLTLTRENGSFLTAATALFIGFVSSCFWRILRLVIHRLYSTQSPRDALHHQRQVLLRNSITAPSAFWSFVDLGWTWRRDVLRVLPVVVVALLSISAFVIASVFSSQLSSGIGNAVLLDGDGCGLVRARPELLGIELPFQIALYHNAANYAQQCYSAEQPSVFDCITYVKYRLPWTTNNQAPCPFPSSICRSNTSNQLLDTGLLDSHDHLGINSPPESRIKFRFTAHCAPITTDGYTARFEHPAGTYIGYMYGPAMQLNGSVASNVTVQGQSQEVAFEQRRRGLSPVDGDLILSVYTARRQNGRVLRGISDFTPIPALDVPDADTNVVFLFANGISYVNKTQDAWYRGIIQGLPLGELPGEEQPVWWPAETLSPMACIHRYQFCNATGHDCGPLSSWRDAIHGATYHFNATPQLNYSSVPPSQGEMPARYAAFLKGYAYTPLDFANIITSLKSNALLSRRSLYGGLMFRIPDNQWQLDMNYWWSTMLACIQSVFVLRASGPTDPRAKEIMDGPVNPTEREICHNQASMRFLHVNAKILSSDYTSFSVLGLCLTYTIGLLIILVSYTLAPILSLLERKRMKYTYLEWVSNETLQLQRAAYQGIGSGSWEGLTDSVPRTSRGEKLADLPLHYTRAGGDDDEDDDAEDKVGVRDARPEDSQDSSSLGSGAGRVVEEVCAGEEASALRTTEDCEPVDEDDGMGNENHRLAS